MLKKKNQITLTGVLLIPDLIIIPIGYSQMLLHHISLKKEQKQTLVLPRINLSVEEKD